MGYRIVYSGKWLGACWLRLRVDSYEDGDNTLFWNSGFFLPDYTVSKPRNPYYDSLPACETHLSMRLLFVSADWRNNLL